MSGDTAVVGASVDDLGVNSAQGSAYVFVRPPSGWATTGAFTAKLTASDGAGGDEFLDGLAHVGAGPTQR